MNCEAECEKYECSICMDFRDQFAKTLQKARTLYDQQIRHQKEVMKEINRKVYATPMSNRYQRLIRKRDYSSFMV